MQAVYTEETTFSGVPVNKFMVTNLGDMSSNPAEKCYCPTPDTCLKKGLMDLSKCGAPVVASMPHFFETDPTVAQGVRGLHPREEDHAISILFESVSFHLKIKRESHIL